MVKFVLVNESTVSTPDVGGALTPAIMDSIAAATSWQLNGDYSQAWGGGYSVRVGASTGSDVQGDEIAVWILNTIDVAGAAGYHSRLSNGAPVAYISRSTSSALTVGSNSLAVTISHEMLEAAGDPGINRWVDRGDGTEESLEMCDRVEDRCYTAPNLVSVSDFLLPAAFDVGAPGPYSHLNSIATATGLTLGGYYLSRSVATDAHQVFPARGAHIVGNPRRESGRLVRRLAR